jgi:hypothetical protein
VIPVGATPPTATPSFTPAPPTPTPPPEATEDVTASAAGTCAFDTNGNGVIDAFDVRRLLRVYGARLGGLDYDPALDQDADGVITAFDVRVLLSLYGQVCG